MGVSRNCQAVLDLCSGVALQRASGRAITDNSGEFSPLSVSHGLEKLALIIGADRPHGAQP